MPIRWSALKVSEAADLVEEFFNRAVGPLEAARTAARETKKLPNLPQYIDWDLSRIIGEIDRAIGGSQFEPKGRIRAGLESLRKDLPADALKTERETAKLGTTQSLM